MELEKTIALLLAGTALVSSPVFAQQAGTATAVNPESQSTPPGGTTTTLQVGARVVHKERIKTTPQGSVQLLFLDRSTLSIAPNSEIVIDEFVYNPGAGSGHMAVSLATGALRFVGGQLSHAAVVARELGVPCVMGTGDGTRRLRTGDVCRVDGHAGTVEVLRHAGG